MGGHRRVAGAKEIADLILLREELEDRFGPLPDPLENLIKLQDARIKLCRAGARSGGFSAGRMRVAPIDLGPAGPAALKSDPPDAGFQAGRSTNSRPVPAQPHRRFP